MKSMPNAAPSGWNHATPRGVGGITKRHASEPCKLRGFAIYTLIKVASSRVFFAIPLRKAA
jgi:hypothetical protein